ALPRDVRRRPDQAARRSVLARSHLLELLLRDAADAQPAQLVLSLAALLRSPGGCRRQSRRGAGCPARVLRAATVCVDRGARYHSVSADSDRQRQPVVAELADDRALHPDARRPRALLAADQRAGRARAPPGATADRLRRG